MFGNYSDYGLDGLDDAFGELDSAYEELEGFGQLQGAAKIALPVLVGSGVAFGSVYVLDKHIEGAATAEEAGLVDKLKEYKWAVGGVAGALAGLAMYKYVGPSAGITAIAASLGVALVGFGINRLEISPSLGAFVLSRPQPVYSRFVTQKPQELFQRFVTEKPQSVYGQMVDLPRAMGQMVNLPRSMGQMVDLPYGAVNPGVFG